MSAEGCRAPKVSKTARKIKPMAEKQFHYAFNNKIDFDEIRQQKLKVRRSYITSTRLELSTYSLNNPTNACNYDFPSMAMSSVQKSKLVKNSHEEVKYGSLKSLSALTSVSSRSKPTKIGSVATFDDFTEIISEFYTE